MNIRIYARENKNYAWGCIGLKHLLDMSLMYRIYGKENIKEVYDR